jgi:hypothetical protein
MLRQDAATVYRTAEGLFPEGPVHPAYPPLQLTEERPHQSREIALSGERREPAAGT